MQATFKNVCTRCGSERIVFKVSKEDIGNSLVTTSESRCPDKDCQKKVDSDNKKQKERVEQLLKKREQRKASFKLHQKPK